MSSTDQQQAETATHTTRPPPPGDFNPLNLPLIQAWTPSGYPVVDGQYIDMATGTVKALESPSLLSGPPGIDAVWTNFSWERDGPDRFEWARHTAYIKDVSEYLVRVGELLKTGACTVHSLSASKYSVTVVVYTELSQREFTKALEACLLVNVRNELYQGEPVDLEKAIAEHAVGT